MLSAGATPLQNAYSGVVLSPVLSMDLCAVELRLTSLSVPSQDWVWLTPVDTEQESFADVSALLAKLVWSWCDM